MFVNSSLSVSSFSPAIDFVRQVRQDRLRIVISCVALSVLLAATAYWIASHFWGNRQIEIKSKTPSPLLPVLQRVQSSHSLDLEQGSVVQQNGEEKEVAHKESSSDENQEPLKEQIKEQQGVAEKRLEEQPEIKESKSYSETKGVPLAKETKSQEQDGEEIFDSLEDESGEKKPQKSNQEEHFEVHDVDGYLSGFFLPKQSSSKESS